MSEEKQHRAGRAASWLPWRRKQRPKSGVRALLDRLPWQRRLVVLGVWYGAVGGVAVVLASFLYFTFRLPNPLTASTTGGAPVIRILDVHGNVLAERGSRHPYMPLRLLPKHLLDAVVAIEDRRFWDHWGIDPTGMLRAALVNLRADGYRQGASTLTQQLAKNLYLTSERTLSRKLEEGLIALWLEYKLSKAEILELYLNRVYFGAGAYGVESASQKYFDKSARELTLAESAVLAGLLKAPSSYSPVSNPGIARSRARLVLARMRDNGAITADTAATAIAASVRFADFRPRQSESGFEYAVDHVYEHLPQLSGIETSELIVETTIDATLQVAAQRAIAEKATGKGDVALQGAFVILDTDGGVKALVGGRSYRESQFNRATQALRQPGSSFKPFVYLAALEMGYQPHREVVDAPIDIDGWRPRNADDRYVGRTTMLESLASSRNTVAVRLLQAVGIGRVHGASRRLGITTALHSDPSLALGTAEMRLIELTGAYAHFANGGAGIRPHVIRQVRMSSGRVVYARRTPRGGSVMNGQVVGAMNEMLHAAVVQGTGRRAALVDHQVAGKTGTTQGARDAWFVGYTSHYTAGVWIGSDSARTISGNAGGGLPAEIWSDVMRVAHQGRKPLPLPQLPSRDDPASSTLRVADRAPTLQSHAPHEVRDR